MTVTQPLKRFGSAVLAVAAGIVLTACVDGTQLAEGGIRGTGMSVGPLTAFGSVYVNGIRFETNEADFVDNDGVSAESDLQKGMILVVDGQWRRDTREGTAEQVLYDDTLRGTVEAIVSPWDAANKTGALTVLGQTVLLGAQTVFRGQAPEAIAEGNAIRVSAWRLSDGRFRAAYVETLNQTDTRFGSLYGAELEGHITALNPGARTFELNGLQVSYDATAFEAGASADDLAEGTLVDVEGDLPSSGSLMAKRIVTIDRRYSGREGDDIELAGAITESYNAGTGQFQLGGLVVRVDSDALEDEGLQLTDLLVDLLVTVEGEFDSQGRIVAEEVELNDGDAEVYGAVSDRVVDDALGNTGTLRVGGVRVVVDERSLITDDEAETRITLLDLVNGDSVEVEGRADRDNEGAFLRAVKIEREDDETGFELTGPVEAINAVAGTISVLGITLQVPVGFDVNSLTPGEDWVNVQYTANGSGYVADSIELEDDDDDEDDD